MPYLGNPAQQRFSSPRAASVYSGDGSTVAFTLEEVVSTDEDILVSVDGVIQEPSVAYAVSSGTTLTFTAAPSTNSGNNIFVYYIARTFGSVSMPDGQNVNAATASFSGDVAVDTNVLKVDTSNNRVGINVTSPSRTLQIAGNGNRVSSFTHSGDYAFATFSDQNTTDDGSVRVGAYGNDLQLFAGGSARILADSTGAVTMPAQPAFLVQMSQDLTNFSTGTDHTIVFNSEVYDINADFNTSNYTFTAPVTGKYNVSCSIYIQNLDTAATYYQLKMVSSLGNYTTILDPNFSADNLYYSWSTSPILLALDANDTVKMQIRQTGGTAQTDINSNALYTHFHGYLVS